MTEQHYRVIADKDTTPDLVSDDAAPGDRLVYDVIDADRWFLVRIERPVEGADPSVQPPTREQIVAVLYDYADRKISTDMAVLALFSQPTPSAEHQCSGPHEDGRPESCVCSLGRSHNHYEVQDAPPSIVDDMAPGTTFTEATDGWPRSTWEVRLRLDGTRYIARLSDGWLCDPKSIDPSTIRDVTPPPTTHQNH